MRGRNAIVTVIAEEGLVARRRRFVTAMVVVVGALLLGSCGKAQTPAANPGTVPTPDENIVPVVRVIDGDTIVVRYRGVEERVRYRDVDTPERGQPGYDEARWFNRELLAGGTARLEINYAESNGRDGFGRLLAYVYVEKDGQEFQVNQAMNEAGHVKPGSTLVPEQYRVEETATQRRIEGPAASRQPGFRSCDAAEAAGVERVLGAKGTGRGFPPPWSRQRVMETATELSASDSLPVGWGGSHRIHRREGTMKLNGSQILCEALVREGVSVVFGQPGGAIMPFYNFLRDYDLRHILCRHEQRARLIWPMAMRGRPARSAWRWRPPGRVRRTW